jgi:oleandomycin transport system ATP-binding protein
MDYAIQAEGLVKRFGGTVALAGVDLAARTGSVLAVLGPNGAGKTTAVRILATLTRPDAGRATVDGYDVVAEAHRVRQVIALTGQYAAVDEGLTGVENLIMIGRLLGLRRLAARRRAAELLDQFELTEAGGRAAKTFSGGMRRRLDLAASLVGRPRVVYLDEPTTGLDPRARDGMHQVIRGLVADGVTVLLTTQYLEEADQLADTVAVIDRGLVAATGTPDQLKAQVSGQILDVRPVEEAHLGIVVRVMAELSGSAPERGNGTVSVAVGDVSLPQTVLALLAEAGVPVAELNLRKPSLDEVFFSLTGHRPSGDASDGGGPGDGTSSGDSTDRSAA